MQAWIASIVLVTAALLSPPAGADPAIARRKAAVVEFLGRLQAEHRTLYGTQVNEFEAFLRCDSVDRLVANIEHEPALLGLELMFAQEYTGYEDLLVKHAVEHTRRGGLVTLAWHARNPLRVCVRGEGYECSRGRMPPEEFARMLDPGTREHALWLADVKAAAKTLRRLRDAGVVVLFRPLHEMNGDWFWWGRQPALPQLWDALHEELERHEGLDNLVWVWSGDRANPEAATYWPKSFAPQVAGTDVYENDPGSAQFTDGHANIRKLFAQGPFAFTEIGHLPSDAVIEQTQPVWILVWGGSFIDARLSPRQPCESCNTAAELKAFFAKPRMMRLADMPTDVRKAIAGGRPAPMPRRPTCPATLLP
ncbi:MAG TPA: glycosyl hydrolase [Steroidobacteraceae bacterium]|jgi:mannan endo-1,4-beta-mannosidase|nr:glycosyl hydrolase [Steroidobacteraceae bacterium]